MRILVVGAGAVGGYFGGRILEAGGDVTFLVRPERAARLAKTGLVIESPFGNVIRMSPPTVLASELKDPFDAIILTCKSYDLDSAIDSITPAIGKETVVIPLLNGMRHLDILDERLGSEHVLGGVCLISARLNDAGHIVHLNDVHQLSFGERVSGQASVVKSLAVAMKGGRFDAVASESILLDMWEKWVFLATLAGMTCLTRSAIGDIVSAGGVDLVESLLEECRAIAVHAGWVPRQEFVVRARQRLTAAGSSMTASMLGDVERGGRTEADHILGDLLQRRATVPQPDHSLLRIAYVATKAYEHRFGREAK